MAVKKLAARWREFGASAFVSLTFVLIGAPLIPVLAAIALVGLWNLYAYRREQSGVRK